jgi:hypothetical protein
MKRDGPVLVRALATIVTAAMMKAYHGDCPILAGEHVQALLTR